MKKYIFILFIFILLQESCHNEKEQDLSFPVSKYIEMGVPDCNRVWKDYDFLKTINTLGEIKTKYPFSLPRYQSEKSGKLFEHLISMKNLSFLNSDTISLSDKAYMIQKFIGIQTDFCQTYTDLYSYKQYYNKELIQFYMFGITIAQKMLDLAYQINASGNPADQQIKSGFPAIRYIYLTVMSYTLEKEKNVSIYDKKDLEILSDSVSVSLQKNMNWFDSHAASLLQRKMAEVVDSTSSVRIRRRYRKIMGLLEDRK